MIGLAWVVMLGLPLTVIVWCCREAAPTAARWVHRLLWSVRPYR